MSRRGYGRDSVYRTIALQLQNRINAGEWLAGQRMPTEAALREEFGVNRLTIRDALDVLRQRGVIESRQGSGTFVTNPMPVLEIAVDPASPVDDGSGHASTRSVIHNVNESVLAEGPDPDDGSAHRLAIPRETVVRLDTVTATAGDPFAVNSYWLDGRRFPHLTESWIGDAPLGTVLRDVFGVTAFYDWRAFSATAAGDLEVEHLGGRPGAPLVVRDGVSVDSDGIPLYYVRRRIRADRAAYVLRYR
ncbi:GntR family transcriptional regulator [Microcella indica]|uniref:GntR family transcriptional regulator n=1 Tax=Microcella indica TaxID=2750620 RepID=UPI0015CF4105|nr:GntR family transcriptional regulator [Microcella indica]